MAKVADFVLQAKARLGDAHMSDREFGERIGGYAQTTVSNARYGNMSDRMAVRVAEVLGVDPGMMVMVARTEREKDPEVRRHLVSYLGKVLAPALSKAARAGGAIAVALGLLFQPAHEARAAGGDGRL